MKTLNWRLMWEKSFNLQKVTHFPGNIWRENWKAFYWMHFHQQSVLFRTVELIEIISFCMLQWKSGSCQNENFPSAFKRNISLWPNGRFTQFSSLRNSIYSTYDMRFKINFRVMHGRENFTQKTNLRAIISLKIHWTK